MIKDQQPDPGALTAATKNSTILDSHPTYKLDASPSVCTKPFKAFDHPPTTRGDLRPNILDDYNIPER
jgi:hypothetical protein